VDTDLDTIVRDYYQREAEFEGSRKGTWTECRYPSGPHAEGFSEWGWCDKHKHPSDRCDIVRNGDQYICRYHHRYWQTGVCPGLRGPLG
jgi:hypothetical protein